MGVTVMLKKIEEFLLGFLSMHPKVPRSRAEGFGFIGCVFVTVMLAISMLYEALSGVPVTIAALITYLVFLGAYGAHTIVSHPKKCELETNGKDNGTPQIPVRRNGELVGFVYIAYCLLVTAAFLYGSLPRLPQFLATSVEGTIGILAGTSILKVLLFNHVKVPRLRHNNLLRFSTFAVSALTVYGLWVDATRATEPIDLRVTGDLVLMYASILVAYATHNRVMEYSSPPQGDKEYGGENVGIVVMFAALVIATLGHLGVLAREVNPAYEVAMATFLILLLSSAAKHFAALRKAKNQGGE